MRDVKFLTGRIMRELYGVRPPENYMRDLKGSDPVQLLTASVKNFTSRIKHKIK